MNRWQGTVNAILQGWDKWAWAIGLGCSTVTVLLLWLAGPTDVFDWDLDRSNGIALFAIMLATLVFPPLLSAIARRRRLLWAYFTPASVVVAGLLEAFPNAGIWHDPLRGITHSAVAAANAEGLLAILLFGPLVTSGLVCVYKWCEGIDRRRELAAKPAKPAETRSGVWPPAPRNTIAQDSAGRHGE